MKRAISFVRRMLTAWRVALSSAILWCVIFIGVGIALIVAGMDEVFGRGPAAITLGVSLLCLAALIAKGL